MNLALMLEIALSLLLMATLAYCVLLERKLSLLRKGQDGLKQTIADLNAAIGNAEASMRLLKTAASGIGGKLTEEIGRGRGLADELSVLTASGERIAERIERGASRSPAPFPAALANRLQALKPQVGNMR